MSQINVPIEMIRKYNQPGPRYTSYPPATHFTEEIVPEPLTKKISECNTTPKPLSLYFHLPFCASQCLYCGCTNIVTNDQTKSATYIRYVEKEIAFRTQTIPNESQVVQIQLGGGTPTFLLPTEIEQLGKIIHDNVSVANAVEAGVEIDPRRINKEQIQALQNAGFNRASLGIQDTNPDVQKNIRRIQPIEKIDQANSWLREQGIKSINFDIIYGLPGQTIDTFTKTLDTVIAMNPDRFAVYSYAHIPWIKPLQKTFEDQLPDAETKLLLLQLTIQKLTAAGYEYIGMDHFANPEDTMTKALHEGTLQRNFQGYSTLKGVQLHGFGMSSISHINNLYIQNLKTLPAYYDALDHQNLPLLRGYIMTAEDQIRYEAIMHIMCNLYIGYDHLSKQLGLNFTDHFSDNLNSLKDLEEDGLLVCEDKGLHVTQLGRLFIRVIAMRFDAYIQKSKRKGRYSQTV